MIDRNQYLALARQEDWPAVHTLLDNGRENAVTSDDLSQETYLRVDALKRQASYGEAIDLLRERGHLYNSQSLAQHDLARVLIKLGREKEALVVMNGGGYEAEMTSFPILAMDAKFFHVTLLAKSGDPSARDRLDEIPDDYLHVTADGDLVTKSDVMSLLAKQSPS